MIFIQIESETQLWAFRVLFIIICAIIITFMTKFARDIYRKNPKYLANIFCSFSFLSYALSIAIYLITLIIFIVTGAFSHFIYKLLYSLIIFGLFFLDETLIIFYSGPTSLFSIKAKVIFLFLACISLFPLFMPINSPQFPEYNIWTQEFTIAVILPVAIHSAIILSLYQLTAKKLRNKIPDKASNVRIRFNQFGKGLVIMLIGLYCIIISMALNILSIGIIGDFLVIFAATRLSKGISRIDGI